MTVPETTEAADVRGEARLIDTVLAIKLVLESRGLCGNDRRLLWMIDWLLERTEGLEPNGTVPTRLFIEAIKESNV